ncbi:bsn [Symbiodinium microadriaticum]|nr:bsn [Symbiodinium microadriaticum]
MLASHRMALTLPSASGSLRSAHQHRVPHVSRVSGQNLQSQARFNSQRALALGTALVGAYASKRMSSRGTSYAALKATATLESWEGLATQARQTKAGEQVLKSWEDRVEGLIPHTDAKVRYFGKDRSKPRVKIYRDQAAWCPYCQKVWLLLEEKQVDYEVEKVPMRSYGDKPREFMALVPRGLLPAMEIDGKVMTESLDIMFTIEGAFPDPDKPMFPASGPLRDRAAKLLSLERQLFGAWCSYLFRPEMPLIGGSERDFTSALQAVDSELAKNTESPFFLPYQHPTIVDMQYVSHVERAVASAMYYKGYDVRKKFAHIDEWLSAYEKLPHYMATKSDYYTHCMDIPPQYGPCFSNDNAEAVRAREDIDPQSAKLPAQWQTSVEPPTPEQLERSEEDYRIEAAMRLTENQQAVTRFCCRAAGGDVGSWARGNPTKCELADPYARPNDDYAAGVNVVLRSIATALLKGDPSPVLSIKASVEKEAKMSGRDLEVIADCICYLRDRVGSPRDLSMPAAKILRAHLAEAVRQRKGYIINGSPPQQEPANRARRPKWRLCFRLDRQTVSAKESLEHLAPKYQHDFFLTVVDPPATGSFRESPPAPFFASRVACHVADLVASRPMIAQLAGRSFEGKALASIGAECMAAGLCAAMLGAKIAFVCERSLEPHVQHNVRLFRRDTLDYTKTKTNVLAVAPCSPGRCGHLEAEVLSEKLQAPSLDMVVLTEVSFARVVGDFGGLVGNRRGEVSAIFQMLGKLIPARSCTKALVICDHSFAMSEESNRRARADEEGDGLPPGLSAALPPEWHARPFCVLPQGIPVIWLERQDAELVRRKPAPIVPRAPMPPMGASSSRCGCGGHMQSPLLGQRVESKEWFANNAKLKEMRCLDRAALVFLLLLLARNIGASFDLLSPSQVKQRFIQEPRQLPYSRHASDGKDVWDALTLMDAALDSTGRIILLYSGYEIDPGQKDHEYQAGWNREHVWPKSHAALSTSKPGPGTDIHNLHAADISVNAHRGNKDFDELVEGQPGVHVVTDSSPPQGYSGMARLCLVSDTAWEPPDAAKGAVARSLMYMACTYADRGLKLVSGKTQNHSMQLGNLEAILRWAKKFPPSERERKRNEVGQSLQCNRNPFIDDPDLFERVLWS